MRLLPYSVAATLAVLALPSLVLTLLAPDGPLVVLLASVVLAMLLSLGLAAAGSALWMRHPRSQDAVFGDLMLWGWLRKARAERRLAKARALVEASGGRAGGAEHAESRGELLETLSAALEARDVYTHGHSRRVTRHSERIAREMGLSPELVAKVRLAAAVHDVGKIHTPREVLTKPGRLDDAEFEVIKRHPVDGAEMVRAIGDPEVTAMVRHHHERLDGTGYPDRLAADEIPLGARIISVADTFDAMTSSRPYRSACRHKKAIDVLAKEAGSQLDPRAVAAFMRYYSGRRSVGWSALLVAVPQRLGAWLGTAANNAGAAAAPALQGIAAVGAAGALSLGVGGGDAASTAKAADRGSVQVVAAGEDASRSPADAATAGDEEGSSPAAGDRRGARGERRRPGRGGGGGDRIRGGDPGAQPRDGGPGGGSGQGGGSGAGDSGSGGTGGGGGDSGGGGSGGSITLPDVEAPGVDVPPVEVGPIKLPEVETPPVEVPSVEVPPVEVGPIKLPKVETPSISVPGL